MEKDINETLNETINELMEMVKLRRGTETELWVREQAKPTARNMMVIDKIWREIMELESLTSIKRGSMGQDKSEVSPLLTIYNQAERTLQTQLQGLGLNYSASPDKINVDTKAGVDADKDPMAAFYQSAKKG